MGTFLTCKYRTCMFVCVCGGGGVVVWVRAFVCVCACRNVVSLFYTSVVGSPSTEPGHSMCWPVCVLVRAQTSTFAPLVQSRGCACACEW